MSKLAKALSGAAGNAGGAGLNVEDVFSTYLYTGSGSNQTITNGIDLDGEGGLVWLKQRTIPSGTGNHFLYDSARGYSSGDAGLGYAFLSSNTTGAEGINSQTLGGFNSNGFSLLADSGGWGPNQNTSNICSWSFRKAPGFFDVVTYTGNGVDNRQISHNLGSVPGMIIVKATSSAAQWPVYHRSLGTGAVRLNLTNAYNSANIWWKTTPTDSYFTVFGGGEVNVSGVEYVAYLFAHDVQEFGADGDESIIKCGVTTVSSATGETFVDLGFEPQWILTKYDKNGYNWNLYDTMRGWIDTPAAGNRNKKLNPNTSTSEGGDKTFQPYASGFKYKNSEVYPGSTTDIIYMAIRRPMKVPESGTEVYNNLANRIGTSAAATISGVGFAVDLMIPFAENTGSSKPFVDRLRGYERYLLPPYGNAEQNTTNAVTSFASNDGVLVGADASLQVINNYYNSSRRYAASFFKRASGFMDVVCWEGDGTSDGSHKPAHGLTVVPQFIISKVRDAADNWACLQSEAVGGAVYIMLNATTGGNAGNLKYYYGDGTDYVPPTSSVFTVTTGGSLNVSGKAYVSYLFATLAGVSKVGSYTGTGADLNVDCGFTAGARFILIKRTDSTGDWYMWDSARGINAGNSPYLIMNTTGASVTNTDYIDPLNAGFTVTSTAPAAINASGGSYIFLAIA